MKDQITPEITAYSSEIANHLVERSIRPVAYPEAIQSAIATSLGADIPLRCRMVLCPNWQVNESGRSIGEIPVYAEGQNLVYGDPSQKINGLLSEEVPSMVKYLNRSGINVQLLVVLADILSPGWVHDPKQAKEQIAQNQKAINLLLQSSDKGKEVFNNPQTAEIKVRSQFKLATNTEGYFQALNDLQVQALYYGSPMNQ